MLVKISYQSTPSQFASDSIELFDSDLVLVLHCHNQSTVDLSVIFSTRVRFFNSTVLVVMVHVFGLPGGTLCKMQHRTPTLLKMCKWTQNCSYMTMAKVIRGFKECQRSAMVVWGFDLERPYYNFTTMSFHSKIKSIYACRLNSR